MKSVLLAYSLVSVLVFGAAGQLVEVGPKGESLKDYCARVEPLHPNLTLRENSQISGRLSDQSGEFFRNSKIELRRYLSPTKQLPVKVFKTDNEGSFDLGTVKRGDYRLLLSSSRAFQQPEKLTCAGNKCILDTVLRVNATDLPASVCPIR